MSFARAASAIALATAFYPCAASATPNPFAADRGGASQHGDCFASDTSPLRGPGATLVTAAYVPLLGVCSSVLFGDDDMPLAVCTQLLNQSPQIFALDAATGLPVATYPLTGGNLFAGVYPYLDNRGRVVIVDGSQVLQRIAHTKSGGTVTWTVDDRFDLSLAVTSHCGDASCDAVVGLTPAYDGRIWFASAQGIVGTVDPSTGAIATTALPAGETITNSIASAPEGTAVVSDHALYVLRADANGNPVVAFRAAYDRGAGRKPGQLGWGSGSTPTFFGPTTGSDYVALVDNASPAAHLLVYRSSTGDQVCQTSIPLPAGYGSENSPVGSGRTVIIGGTYGYPYPALPPNAPPSVPSYAPIAGGIARIDVNPAGTDCAAVWSNTVASAAVPKLSLADGLLYTTARNTPFGTGVATPLDTFDYVAIDAATGSVRARQFIGQGPLLDTMQLAGTLVPGRAIFQGVFGGVVRIAPLF